MKIKTIIFDFDGTIADTLPFTFKKIIEIVRQLKINKRSDKEIIQTIRTSSYRHLMKEFKISWLKLPWIMSIVKKTQKELYNEIDKIKLFPGIIQTLKQLKKQEIQLGILSSNIQKNIEKFLLINKITEFDFINCESNFFGKDKAILSLIKRYQLNKEMLIYVGDEVRDIEACKKIGVKVAAVGWGFNAPLLLKEYQPDYLFNKPTELIGLITN